MGKIGGSLEDALQAEVLDARHKSIKGADAKVVAYIAAVSAHTGWQQLQRAQAQQLMWQRGGGVSPKFYMAACRLSPT